MTWDDALWALAAVCVDPSGLKGIWLRTAHGPVTQEWLDWLYALRADTVKIPCNIDPERLLGGLDLALTLQLGRPVQQTGVLAQCDGKLLLCALSERLPKSTASIIAQVLETSQLSPQFGHQTVESSFGLIAVDESTEEESPFANALSERLAIWLDLTQVNPRQSADDETLDMLERTERALQRDPRAFMKAIAATELSEQDVRSICELAHGFGIGSMRAPRYAARLACVLALLRGSPSVEAIDLGRAARLTLTPRALSVPSTEPMQSDSQDERKLPPDSPPSTEGQENSTKTAPGAEDFAENEPLENAQEPSLPDVPNAPSPGSQHSQDQTSKDPSPPGSAVHALETTILEAALATLPHDLLSQLMQGKTISRTGASGRAGAMQMGAHSGRPLSPLKGLPKNGERLHVLATLRHAAPRQRIRALNRGSEEDFKTQSSAGAKRLFISSEDFHVQRFAKRSESCVIFCIDASGSAALERLAEAKGAVELLLKDSYVRRDHICVIGFRDKLAQVHLPLTRSLVRAKRELQALPGGGGTPLAHALKLALETAVQAQNHALLPTLVVLSDGRANVTLQGQGSRSVAKEQAMLCAQHWRSANLPSIWLDTSARPDLQAQEIAQAMGASYVPLPLANSQRMASVVQNITAKRS